MRAVWAIGCAIGALVLAGAASAQPGGDTRRHFEGEVLKIDLPDETLELKSVGPGSNKEAHYAFTLRSDLEFVAKGAKKQLGDLAAGDHVKVSYREVRGLLLVSRVEVLETQRKVSSGPRRP